MAEIRRTNKAMFFIALWLFASQFIAVGVLYAFYAVTRGVEFPDAAWLLLAQLLMNVIPFIVYKLITRKRLSEILPVGRPDLIMFLLALIIAVCAMPAASFLGIAAQLFAPNSVGEVVSGMSGNTPYIIGALCVAVSPGLFEESVYRGVILSGYKKAPVFAAALISGLFFGVMHMNAQQFMYAVFVGAIFAVVVRFTRSILCGMAAHMAFNLVQWSAMYGVSQNAVGAEVEADPLAQFADMPEASREIAEKAAAFMAEHAVAAGAVVMAVLTAITIPILIVLLKTLKRHCEQRYAAVDAVAAEAAAEVAEDGETEPTATDERFTWGAVLKSGWFWGVFAVWGVVIAITLFGQSLLSG